MLTGPDGHAELVNAHDEADGVFDPVARFLRLPFRTPDFINKIVRGSIDTTGKRTLQTLITTWDIADGGPFAASAISATSFG